MQNCGVTDAILVGVCVLVAVAILVGSGVGVAREGTLIIGVHAVITRRSKRTNVFMTILS